MAYHGPKVAGRDKGTPNKRTVELREELEKFYIANPHIERAEIALASIAGDKTIHVDTRVSAARALMPFVWPRRAMIALTGADGESLTLKQIIEAQAVEKARDVSDE